MGADDTIDDFDKAFAEAVAEADADTGKSDAQKVIDDAAAKAADTSATADADVKKSADDAAALAATTADADAKKAADDAAAKAEADKAKTPEQIAEEKKAAEDAAKVEADAKVKEAADAATKKIVDDTLAAQRVADEAAALAAKKKDPPVETAAQKAAREKFEESITDYVPTDREKEQIEKFKTEFPDEFAAMQAQFKSTDRNINARVYAAVQTVLQQIHKDVAPLATQVQHTSLEQHVAKLKAAHADYDQVITKVPDWIKTQPAYLRPHMQAVYDEGDAQSVIELVTNYKDATKVVADPAKAAADAAKQAAADAAAAKAKSEAASLTPVGSKRTTTGTKGQADPNDFDGAFAEAAELAEAGK
jgi:hypothetical protein